MNEAFVGLTDTMKNLFGAVIALLVATVFIVNAVWAEPNPNAFQNGMAAYNAGKYEDAIKFFKEATQANPKNADAYYNMGAVYYKQQKYADALTTFNQLLKISPNDQSARYHVASIYEKQGKIKEAIAAYQLIKPDSSRYQAAQAKLKTLQSGKPPATTTANNTNKPPVKNTGTTQATKPPTPTTSNIEEFANGFTGPTGLAMDTQGFLIVANYSKHCIDKVNQAGQRTNIVCNSGIKGPVGLVVDRVTNTIYVANHLDNSVAKVTPDGKVTIISKNLSQPYNLYLDEQQRQLYVSQQKSNSVARIKL